MDPIVLPLHDDARGRPLPTTVYVPRAGATALLIVFGHGFWGHPRKFTRLFGRWVNGGYLVAAPAFPHKTGENPPPYLIEDVANQPGDVSFVLDELLARALGDSERVGVGGFDSSHAAVIDPAVSVLESASFTAASGTPSNSSRLARTPQPPIEATSRRVGVGPASSQPRGAADVAPPSLVAGPSPSTCRESCVSSAVTSTDISLGSALRVA